MAIKLNDKGKLKVAMADVRVVMLPTDPPKYRASKEADVLEFDTDDFKDVVVLTIDEACEILDYLGYLHLSGGRDSFLKGLEKCNQNLYERIEQAGESYEIK